MSLGELYHALFDNWQNYIFVVCMVLWMKVSQDYWNDPFA